MKKTILALAMVGATSIMAPTAQAMPALKTEGPGWVNFANISSYNMQCRVDWANGDWFVTPVIAPGYNYTVNSGGPFRWRCSN